MAVHGTLASFQPEVEDWTEYMDQLSYYFIANGISDNAKNCAILISYCGPVIFHLIKSLVFPDSLTDFSFAQIVEKVRVHREPKTSTILRRFQFNSRTHAPDKSVGDYVAALRRLTEHCAYGEMLEEMLHDRLVCGINNAAIQRRLLAESDLTLVKAVAVAQVAEIADTEVKQLQSSIAGVSIESITDDKDAHKCTSEYPTRTKNNTNSSGVAKGGPSRT